MNSRCRPAAGGELASAPRTLFEDRKLFWMKEGLALRLQEGENRRREMDFSWGFTKCPVSPVRRRASSSLPGWDWVRTCVALLANPNASGGLAGPIGHEAGWMGPKGAAPCLGPTVTICGRLAWGCEMFCFSRRWCSQ